MKIVRDVMTSNPVCCTPEETAATAARLMKLENVGSIPVVDNHEDKKLLGIVTDRDLALEVVAESRDASKTQVGEVMRISPQTCRLDDDVDEVMDIMARHQIRRVPVVDDSHRAIGIVAQGDVATRVDEPEKTGEVVAKISES